MTKKILWGVVIFFVALACLTAGGQKEAAEETGEANIVFAAYGYLAQDKIGRISEAFYKKYPNVKVDYVDFGSKDYIVRLDTMIASGEQVDMALAMDFPLFAPRAMSGMFMEIESYLTEDGFDVEDAFGEGIKASYIKGKLYGLPYTKGGVLRFL